jgi:TetR/AcrR family tetracycline transcriptional repressor
VIDMAQQVLSERGFDGLTMRGLAQRCGVTAMSLYRHVRTKEELLVILADRLLDDLDVPDLTGFTCEDHVRAVFSALHRMWRAHPEFGRIAATQPVDGTVAFRWMEVVLGALRGAGLTDAQAVDAYDTLSSYTAGFLQQHAGSKASAIGPSERLARLRESARDCPNVITLAERLVDRDDEKHFDTGLRIVLNGVFGQLS